LLPGEGRGSRKKKGIAALFGLPRARGTA